MAATNCSASLACAPGCPQRVPERYRQPILVMVSLRSFSEDAVTTAEVTFREQDFISSPSLDYTGTEAMTSSGWPWTDPSGALISA